MVLPQVDGKATACCVIKDQMGQLADALCWMERGDRAVGRERRGLLGVVYYNTIASCDTPPLEQMAAP